jgi:hypothetical protein
VKLTKNTSGGLYLEIESKAGIRDKIESITEYARGRRTSREYNLDNVNATVVKEGLRIENENGDFYFVDIPREEARRFVEIMEQSTNLMDGIET